MCYLNKLFILLSFNCTQLKLGNGLSDWKIIILIEPVWKSFKGFNNPYNKQTKIAWLS